jgi:hypothetical protein
MLNLRPVRLGWRESVSLRRFQNYNLLEMHYFRRHGVEDGFEQYPQQTTLLDGLQFLRAAGRRADLQSFGASPSPGIVPSHHGTGGALDASRNLVE